MASSKLVDHLAQFSKKYTHGDLDEAIKLIQAVSALAAEFNGGLPEVLELAIAVKGFSAQAPAIKNVGQPPRPQAPAIKKRRPATATTGQGHDFGPRHRLHPLRR